MPRTTIGYDGSRTAFVPMTEELPPTHVMALFETPRLTTGGVDVDGFAREAFAVGGQFAPGSIAAPRIDNA